MDGIYFMNAPPVEVMERSYDRTNLSPHPPMHLLPCRGSVVPGTYSDDGHDPSSCHIYWTISDIPGLGRVTYLFSNEKQVMTPAMAHITDPPVGFAIYNWYSRGELMAFEERNEVTPGYEGHIFCLVSPVVGDWIFLGEIDKYVPASRLSFQRVSSFGAIRMEVVATGVTGERIRVCAARKTDLNMVCRTLLAIWIDWKGGHDI
jgi:hypothetical protein